MDFKALTARRNRASRLFGSVITSEIGSSILLLVVVVLLLLLLLSSGDAHGFFGASEVNADACLEELGELA